MHPAKRITSVAALSLLIVLALAACAPRASLTAATIATASPQETATMPPQPLPNNLDLNSIAMVSPSEGWAVGNTTPPPDYNVLHPPPGKNYVDPVLLHYTQGHWSQAALPALDPNWGAIQFNSISMTSASEGWVVGNSVLPPGADGFSTGIVLHFLHGQWTVSYEQRASRIFSIFMRAPDDGWMVGIGNYPSQQEALVLHYTGSQWVPVLDPLFNHMVPDAVASVAENSVWITGINYADSGPDWAAPEWILHFDGAYWTRAAVQLGNSRLAGFALLPSGEGWIVGGSQTVPNYGLILHYQHGAWEEQARVPAPADTSYYILSSVTMLFAGEGWAVGPNGTLLHYHLGVWAPVPSPTRNDLRGVALLSASEGWAVGAQSALLHYHNGAWSQVGQ
jgi:hypothetical protein